MKLPLLLAAAALALAAPASRASAGGSDRPAAAAPRAPGRGAARSPQAAPPAAAPAPPTHFRADETEYRYKQRRTVMAGHVRFTREDATLTCNRATGDNDEAGGIRRAVCEGDVELTRGDRRVSCARAVYDAAAATVTCPGDATLRDGQSVTRGRDLVYDLDADSVRLKQLTGTLVQKPGEELPIGPARRRAP